MNPPSPRQQSFGLLAWLESTQIALPLRAIECEFQITGDLLNVQVDQVFVQSHAQPLDCLYTFPLPAGAAVYRCEMHVNGRVIRAVVEEEQKARELVRLKKAEGHRTALVELNRDNLFTLSLGNIQSGDTVVIRLSYFQTVSALGDWKTFHIPFCPGVRYVPGNPLLRSPSGRGSADDTDQVPDASRISPPRMSPDSPDVAALHIRGTLDNPGGRILELSSPSHPIAVRSVDGRMSVGLASGATIPDQDFVVRWTEKPVTQIESSGWTWSTPEAIYALVRLVAPAEPVSTSAAPQGADFYFLLDHSGSMEGLKWQRSVESLQEFLRSLRGQDRVWLTLFGDTVRDFAEKPLRPSEFIGDRALASLERNTPQGGTEMLPAMNHLIQAIRQHSKDRTATIVLITDGQIANEAQVLGSLRNCPEVAVHVVGVDTAPNDGFLKSIAEQNGGSWHQAHPNDNWAEIACRLAKRFQPPFLRHVVPGTGWELASNTEVILRAGDAVNLLLKRSASKATTVLELTATDAAGSPWRSTVTECLKGDVAVQRLWERSRIISLLAEGKPVQAIELAKAATLICQGTAFVAWDAHEKVRVGSTEVYMPAVDLAPRMRMAAPRGLKNREGGAALCGEGLFSAERTLDMIKSLRAQDVTPCVTRYLGKVESRKTPGGLQAIVERCRDPKTGSLDRELMAFAQRWIDADLEAAKLVPNWPEFCLTTAVLDWFLALSADQRRARQRELHEWMSSRAPRSPDVSYSVAALRAWVERAVPENEPRRTLILAKLEALRSTQGAASIPGSSKLDRWLGYLRAFAGKK